MINPPSVSTIPNFQTMDVPTIGAMQGINRMVRNRVLIRFDGNTEIILARNRVITILAATAAIQKNNVFFTAFQNTSS